MTKKFDYRKEYGEPPTDPKLRLLHAMIILNAINHRRPVPDLRKIKAGFVVRLDPSDDRATKQAKVTEAMDDALRETERENDLEID